MIYLYLRLRCPQVFVRPSTTATKNPKTFAHEDFPSVCPSAGRPPAWFGYSLAGFFRIAISSCLMSSGDNFGRLTVSVSLLSLPVNLNGGW